MLRLRHCTYEFTKDGCTTHFPDGTKVDGHPHWNSPHYYVVAHRLGYQDDLLGYVRDHELLHSLVCEWLFDKPNVVLWGVAHGEPPPGKDAAFEEAFVQAFQRFMRANERPSFRASPCLRHRNAPGRLGQGQSRRVRSGGRCCPHDRSLLLHEPVQVG